MQELQKEIQTLQKEVTPNETFSFFDPIQKLMIVIL